ncbi:unnamed protein product [Camellia sinensis]
MSYFDVDVLRAGWEEVVVEKSISPPTRRPIGAGLSLDIVSQKIVNSWLRHPHLLQTSTLPLSIDLRNSVTMKVSSDMIKEMYEEAEKVWVPEMVKLMKETKEPFINVIYDCDPLEQIVWDNVVLVGDAAHPITPHSSRSRNMAILDAAVLGKCLEKRGAENLHSALGEFRRISVHTASSCFEASIAFSV